MSESESTESETETCERCTTPVGGDSTHCPLHQFDPAPPETSAEQAEKLRRLKALKEEVEAVSELLGNPDNGKLTPCISQIESTIKKIEKPVEERFRYGDYRDTSPVESANERSTE